MVVVLPLLVSQGLERGTNESGRIVLVGAAEVDVLELEEGGTASASESEEVGIWAEEGAGELARERGEVVDGVRED